MSATGFVFAQRLQAHLKFPVGLINANKGEPGADLVCTGVIEDPGRWAEHDAEHV